MQHKNSDGTNASMESEDTLKLISGTVNAYDTSVGQMIPIKPVLTALNRFLIITNNKNLNYEYRSDEDTRLVFIAGWDEDEKDIPIWDFPIAFRDSKHNETVAVDLRKYLNKPTNGVTINNLSDIVRDKTGYNYTVLNTLITNEMINNNFGKFKPIEKTFVSGYAIWLSTSIANAIMLGLDEKLYIEIVAQHFMYSKLVSGKITLEDVNTIVNKISNNKLSIPTNIKVIKAIVDKLNHDVSTMEDLVDNMKIVLGEDKSIMINTSSLISIIANAWFGPNGTETVLIAVENIPTWISMMYISVTTNSYKNSRISMILDKNKNKLGIQDFSKYIELYLKENTYTI